MINSGGFEISKQLPFYWRLKELGAPSFEIPEKLPFEFSVSDDGLLIQTRNQATLNALEIVYGTCPTYDITASCFTRYAHLKVFEPLVLK